MQQYMKAVAVMSAGQVQVVDNVPIPEPGDYEMLVKVHACGFCSGTDFHIINGRMTKKERFFGFPTILGHEGAGEVVKLGKKVRNYKLGDRFIHPNLRPEVGNGYTKTFGGMAEYGLVNDNQAMLDDGFRPEALPFPLHGQFPNDIDFVDAGMLLSLCECHSAAVNFGVAPGQKILVYGCGPMGLALAMFCKMKGAEDITIIDHHDDRLERAKKVIGVSRVINSSVQDIDEVIGGELFDLVVDAVGSSRLLIEGSNRLKPGGRVGSLGVLGENDRILNVRELRNNTCLHMLNFPYGEYALLKETAAMVQKGLVRPSDFYSHVVPFQEIDKALELVRNKKALKVILTF